MIEGIGDDFIPGIVEKDLIDDIVLIDDLDAINMAKRIAKGFKNSSGHWAYVGDSQYGYIAVGVHYNESDGKWYCCVCMSSKNYGD